MILRPAELRRNVKISNLTPDLLNEKLCAGQQPTFNKPCRGYEQLNLRVTGYLRKGWSIGALTRKPLYTSDI